MTNDKVKVSVYIPFKIKIMLAELSTEYMKAGSKKSYGDIIVDALVRVHGKEMDG